MPPLSHLPVEDQKIFNQWISNPNLSDLVQIVKEAVLIDGQTVWFTRLKLEHSQYRGFCEAIQYQTAVRILLIEVMDRASINYKEKSAAWLASKKNGLDESSSPEDLTRQGYVFEKEIDGNNLFIQVMKDGKVIAKMDCAPSSAEEGKLYPLGLKVDPEFQRKGLATAMYKMAEEHFGMELLKHKEAYSKMFGRERYERSVNELRSRLPQSGGGDQGEDPQRIVASKS